MEKKIVGKFNSKLTNIEFYEIVDNFKNYTILRKQGTNKHFAWDNDTSMLSSDLHMISIPDNKVLYKEIIDHVQTWYFGDLFFWADSKFVTEYGSPNYDMLVAVYRQLLQVKDSECDIIQAMTSIREEAGYFAYLRCLWSCGRYLKRQRKAIDRFVKEFKLIW